MGRQTTNRTSSAGTPLAIASAVLAGLIVGLLATVLMISVAGMIFSGPLAGFLREGIGLSLFGGVALGIAGAFGTSFRGTICHPQDVTGVILALSAAAIAGRLAGGDPGALYATVAVLIALASVVTGLAFIAAGACRLGVLARFIPYPVMGGFLAAAFGRRFGARAARSFAFIHRSRGAEKRLDQAPFAQPTRLSDTFLRPRDAA
ncbi:MAG: hypothetical protein H0T41_08705 [Rhodobacteraceae bacterium]|nr:hypothetical protein [Paracoccaceae bacterium]